jgi:hypothetical protein
MIREQNMVVNRRGGVGQSLWVFEVLVSGNDDGSAVIWGGLSSHSFLSHFEFTSSLVCRLVTGILVGSGAVAKRVVD